MTQAKDYAFPVFTIDGLTENGMTLRDYLASNISIGLMAKTGSMGSGFGPDDIAERAYEIADAMLKVRTAAVHTRLRGRTYDETNPAQGVSP